MISGGCPHCDWSFLLPWDGTHYGYECMRCENCERAYWVELSRLGVTRTHEAFIRDVATPDGRVEEANETMMARLDCAVKPPVKGHSAEGFEDKEATGDYGLGLLAFSIKIDPQVRKLWEEE